ncbi:uncharacterized protein LOC142609186 [Castanea sativa]|uniref:uncharacterized protein LOC142609186 n=1 Tax=Castanea sativa TaxID=21020 RepID=UPI003F649ED3
MSSIDLYLYYGGELCNDVTYGVAYEGPGTKLEIIQLKKRREINLKKLKKKIMKELNLDRRLQDIKITYRAPLAMFSDRIVFTPIEIKGDKHVKIMFDRINSTPQLKAAELYISVEPRIEVGGADVQQTTLEGGGGEEFQLLHADSHPILTPSTIVGGYTLPCQETPTPMEDCGSSYQQEYIQSLGGEGEDEDEDEDDVDHGRDEYEEMIGRDDFHENTINYENVDNVCDDVVDDHDDDAIEFQDDIGDGDHATVPTYEAHGLSFHANTWDNVIDPSSVEIPFSSSWGRGMNFSKGLIFPNKEAVKQALIVYSLDNNKNYITEWSNQKRLCVKCANESCAWKVRAFSQPKLNGLWAVKVFGGPHTCPSVGVNKDGRMMDSNFLAKELHKYILDDHTSKIKDLQNLMKERFNHDISYYKIWDAKQKAIANIHGNWEESYQKLQKLLLAYKDSDPGTQVKFRSINRDIPGTIIFKYVFWAFAPSIAGFAHCRPVISIDGTHLYGKYKGKLLIAMATDANNEIFPLAFAVVDDETGASWGWFLECLRTAIRDVVPNSGICIISDRHKGIISSIAQWPNNYVPV